MKLTVNEARVIGCLLEKETTTPEQYPLSLNALTLACNQKTSRDPVMELSEATVLETLQLLQQQRLIIEVSGFGSRVSKYQHRFCNTEFSDLQFSAAERAIVCVMLLRGPQTAGELRTRCQRLFEFGDISQVEQTLSKMLDNGWLVQLAKEPGKREQRFAHTFTDVETASISQEPFESRAPAPTSVLALRVEALEHQVAELQQQLTALLNR
ncbi:YceH family protein [Shewanella sp.]|uniref:YceH family protein n=1 Tax=Shewanella sp. TaxID=50422 RepID=UPI003A98213F